MEVPPYADLYVFNTTATRLLELVNAYMNDPYDDSENFKALQPYVEKLLETTEEIIRRKTNRVIAEMIVQNFGLTAETTSTEVQEQPNIATVGSNKRKSPDSEAEEDIDVRRLVRPFFCLPSIV